MLTELLSRISQMEGKSIKKGKRYTRDDYEGIHEQKRLDFVTGQGVPLFASREESDEDVCFKISFREHPKDGRDFWYVREEDCDDLIEYFTKMKNILIVENREKNSDGKLAS